MANRITLRHGSTAPSASNLLPYELGWDQNTLGLYIGQDGAAPLLISSGGGNVTGVRGSEEQEYRHGNVIISAADVGAATSNHTHALSLAADTGTSSITLAASSKYKLTAGGSTYIFTTPPNTWNALSTSQAGYVAQAPNDTGKFLRGDATWAAVTATNVGLGNVSNNANLNSTTGAKGDIIYWSAANTPAHLTNTSSTTKKFLSITSQVPSWTTLSNSDVGLGNVENTKLSTWTGSSNITTLGTISTGTIPWDRLSNVPSTDITTDSGTSSITLAANTTYKITAAGSSYIFKTPPDNNTDTKVKQSGSTTASWRKILLHYTADNTSTTAVTTATNEIYAAVGISVQPSTGTLRASIYNVNDNATIQYNSTNGCLEIIV